MTGRRWRRLGPWLTPGLVAVEIVLVWSGLLRLRDAVLIAVAVEAALAVAATGRGIAAVRRFRAGRAGGQAGWEAAEDGLAQLVPRRLARVLLIEARMWVCLVRWLTGRHDGTAPHAHRYGRNLRVLLAAITAATALEGAVVEFVVAALLPGTGWPWVLFGLHAYALLWLAGLAASLRTRPHLVEPGRLRLRDSVFTEITIPLGAVLDARPVRRPGPPRSGWVVEPGGGTAVLSYGDATIALTLDPGQPVHVSGRPAVTGIRCLYVSADDPDRLLRAVRSPQPQAG